MYERSLDIELEEHLELKHTTVINGMRRVGKSTTVKNLLAKVKHKNKIYLDCERIEIRNLFNIENYISIKEELELMSLDFNSPCVIALDEIQLIKNLPSFIKYMYDTYHVKFIVTGSSSFYMKNQFSESLAGRKKIFEMYPLNFEEFIHFKNIKLTTFKNYKLKTHTKQFYNRFKAIYQEYMQFGGFPEVVLSGKTRNKVDLTKDIINSYIDMDVKILGNFSASDDLYKLTKLLAARVGSQLDYTKLSSAIGLNRFKVKEYVELLHYTYFLDTVRPYTTNIDKEISSMPKIYFSDTGILNQLAEVDNGILFENMIACQLKHLGKLNYYKKKSGQEIDFILNEKIAIEVKSTPIEQDYKVLQYRASDIKMKEKWLIGQQAPGNGYNGFIWGGNIF
jgi:uncharacterized protein